MVGRVPYQVGAAPHYGDFGTLSRWCRREYERIAQALAPSLYTGYGAYTALEPISFDATEVWQPFLTDDLVWEEPEGVWTAGVYTARYPGLYDVNAGFTVSLDEAGNRNYYLGIRVLVDGTPVLTSYNSAQDDFPCQVTVGLPARLSRGQTISFEVTAVHEQRTVSANANGWSSVVISIPNE